MVFKTKPPWYLLVLSVSTLLFATQASALTISGTCKQADKITDCTDTGTIRVAHHGGGGTLFTQKQDIVAGTWTVSGLPALATGLIITVFIEGAPDHQEAVAVFNYGSTVGDVTGVELIETHLSLGADTTAGLSNNDLRHYDNAKSEDVFHDVDNIGPARALTVDVTGDVPTPTLYLKNNTNYAPGGNINTHHVEINGTLGLGTNTMNVSGNWDITNGTFNRDTSTVNFTGSGTIRNDISTWWDNSFYNLTAAAVGETTTILASRGTVVQNILTLGTGTLAGGIMVVRKSGTPFITAGATLSNSQFKYSPPVGTTVNITAGTYPDLWLAENSTSSNSSFILSGNINCDTLIIRGNSPGKTSHVTTNGWGVACNNVEIGHISSSRTGKLIVNNSSALIIENNLTIFNQSGANELEITGTLPAYSIEISGHWRNFDTFTAGTNSTVRFQGTQNQEITSSGSPFFNVMKNLSTSTLTLKDPLTTNGFLGVFKGKLDTGNHNVTIFGEFSQNSGGLTGEVDANSSTITAHGDFVADGTLSSTGYNNATLILPNTGTLGYTNLSAPWGNGFGNVTVGQAGNTTTLTENMTIRNQLTVGSGTLEGTGKSLFLHGNTPLSFDNNSTVNLETLRLFGPNQTLPTLNNGYNSHINLNRTNVTQTGDITLKAGKNLLINADGVAGNSSTYSTNGFNLTIGGKLQLGAGNDTALKALDISNSTLTIARNIDIRTGANALTSINSNIILNGTGVQNITTNGKAFDTLTQTNASAAGVIFNDGFTVNQLTNTTPNSKMTFTSGETYTINNGVTLQGASGQLITLAPSIAGSHWNFNLNSGATKAIDYVSVSWSDASGSHSTQKRIDPSNSLDDGTTIDWFSKTLITVEKEATLISDPINGSGANKNHIPGAMVEYNITVKNSGTASPDANTVIIVDTLDENLEYDVTTGVVFSDGSTSSALSLGTVSYAHSATPTLYTYTPTGSFDANVASIKIETIGSFAFGGTPVPEFNVRFQVRIK